MLLRTSENANHYHMAYIRPDSTGVTSNNNNHVHEIVREKVNTSIFDDMGNEQVQETECELVVLEVNGHIHNLQELQLVEVKEKELSDEDEVNLCYGLYKSAIEDLEDSRNDAEKAEKYIKGDQWEETDKINLKKEERACLTINETKPKVDMLSGHFRQNRTDINLSPIEQGDARTCDLYNIRIKNILQLNNYDYQETYTFENQSRLGCGFMKVFVDADNGYDAEVKVQDIYWKNGFIGPHKELDGSDAEYAGEIIPISKAKLKELYPDKVDDIEKDFEEVGAIRKKGVVPRLKSLFYTRKQGTSISSPAYDYDILDIAKQEYKMIAVQRKIYKRTPVLFNSKHDFYFNCEVLSKKDLESVRSIEELSYINSVTNKVRETVFAGKTLLSSQLTLFHDKIIDKDGKETITKGYITIVPFYANKQAEYWWGKVKEVMGLQQMLNKLYSQAVDIINKCARYGIAITSEAFESTGDFNKFARDVNKPGFITKMKEGFKEHIHEFQGVKYPTELVTLMQQVSGKMNIVLNVYPEMMGQQGRAESGVAIAQKLRQGLVGNEYLYDNFSLSKRRIGKLIIKGIQIVDSPEKILRIVENQNNKTKVEVAGQELYPQISFEEKLQLAVDQQVIQPDEAMMIQELLQTGQQIPPEYQQIIESMQTVSNQIRREELLQLLDNNELTKYDVVVIENTQTPTMMLSNYILLAELAGKGIPIPPNELINLMPNLDQKVKDRMIDGIQQTQQQQAEMESKKFDTEIQKSLIAAQNKQTGTPSGVA